MRNLISIAEHSDYLHHLTLMSMSERWDLHRKRINFGRQSIELWMFVPCDFDGNVLELPGSAPIYTHSKEYIIKWKEAKDRCLFEGIEYVKAKKEGHYSFLRIANLSEINYPALWRGHTVEDLIKYNLKFTTTALQLLGL